MVSDQPIWTALILPQLDCADLKFETLACMANTLSFLASTLSSAIFAGLAAR
jgi:hypothetical protein